MAAQRHTQVHARCLNIENLFNVVGALKKMQVPKDIVVYIDAEGRASWRAVIDHAVSLATTWNSHVIVAFAPEDLVLRPHTGFVRGAAIHATIASHEERKQVANEELQIMLAKVAAATGLRCELRICTGQTGEALMLHARHASLAIVAASRSADLEVTALTLSEDVIFASGRPSMLIPADWRADRTPGKIVIGWNASREAARAVADSIPFLLGAEAVHVVVVPEPKVSGLLGEDPGADISRHLARYGVKVVLDCLEGPNAGELILGRAEEIGANMIVMGAYGQSRITEFVFGSATRTLLAQASIPILLSR